MSLMMITYDLSQPGQQYKKVWEYLEAFNSNWHALGSVWFVVTDKTAGTVRNELAKLVDSNDKLIVINVSKDEGAWRNLSDAGGTWLKREMER